ncbi:hypothetical protein ACJIZ3_019360 [Penstemon smallii]|uniref:ARID domain-containing protein n=1 Tax=Penstemon smallii TaxID=265156 RepID=A0ABD3T1K2_9LAMI
MVKGDVEMDGAENLPSAQESEYKVLCDKVERKGENFPSEAPIAGDANKSENGSEALYKLRDEAEDNATVKSEIEDQINPKGENVESTNSVGLVVEDINAKSVSEDQINTNTKAEQTGASAMKMQNDGKHELVEQIATNGGVKEEKSTENGVDGGSHFKNVMEENNAEKMPKESDKEDGDCVEHVAGEERTGENADTGNDPKETKQLPTDISVNKAFQSQSAAMEEVLQDEDEKMKDAANLKEDKTVKGELKEQVKEIVHATPVTDGNSNTVETAVEHDGEVSSLLNQHEATTPNSLVRYATSKAGGHSVQTGKTVSTQATQPLMAEGDDGTPEDQATFMKELESFYRGRAMDFKPPKFYGQPLNCLKLWRAVIRLGGYDRVTGSKLWRQVGESFHPPKTCTTVSWTFRIFYEKSLLEFERNKTQSGELQLPIATIPEASGVDNEGSGYHGSGLGRARRDSAARAMQGWHVQRLFGNDEDKDLNSVPKREKNLKSIGSLKQKRPNEVENSIKCARTETSKQLSLIGDISC